MTLTAAPAAKKTTYAPLELFDTDRFRRHVEAAYTTLCEAARRGEAARAFDVEPLS